MMKEISESNCAIVKEIVPDGLWIEVYSFQMESLKHLIKGTVFKIESHERMSSPTTETETDSGATAHGSVIEGATLNEGAASSIPNGLSEPHAACSATRFVPKRTKNAATEVFSRHPTVDFEAQLMDPVVLPHRDDFCIICIAEFEEPKALIQCGHIFCHDCIIPALEISPTCPICVP